MYCPMCGTDREKTDVICSRCGYELPPVQSKGPLILVSVVFLILCGTVIFVFVALVGKAVRPTPVQIVPNITR